MNDAEARLYRNLRQGPELARSEWLKDQEGPGRTAKALIGILAVVAVVFWVGLFLALVTGCFGRCGGGPEREPTRIEEPGFYDPPGPIDIPEGNF